MFSMIIKIKLPQITLKFPKSRSSMATAAAAAAAAAPVLELEMGSCYIPKQNPSKPLGEDAHFVYSEKQVAGVADGVGGWATKGIDAGEYARDLIRNCVVAVAAADGAPVKPKKVLAAAHSRTAAAGTSTACVVSFDGVQLRAANLGDSGFMIFRDGGFIYRSPVQQRGFNCPYQMGAGNRYDMPAAAWRGKFRMAAGDIVVVGTDGFFDNVFKEEIKELLEAAGTAADLAGILAARALNNSVDESKDGPFAVAARKAGRPWRGGKIDDITVIVLKFTAAVNSSI